MKKLEILTLLMAVMFVAVVSITGLWHNINTSNRSCQCLKIDPLSDNVAIELERLRASISIACSPPRLPPPPLFHSMCPLDLNFTHPANKKVLMVRVPIGDAKNITVHPFQYVHDPARDRIVSAAIWNSGYWQEAEVKRVLAYLYKDPIGERQRLLDVGANIGAFTVQAIIHGFEVVAIEPFRYNLELLRATIALNNWCDRVMVHPFIVHQEVGTSPLCITSETSQNEANGVVVDPLKQGHNTWSRFGCKDFANVTTIDALMVHGGNGYPNIGIMKMDIEGFEVKALRGAREFMTRFPPCVVLLEVNLQQLDTNKTPLSDLDALLYEYGYTAPKRVGGTLGDIYDVEYYPRNPLPRCANMLK